MRERNHSLSTSLPNAPVWLQADPVRLEQVLVNLLFNAAKYTQPGGRIHLSAERQQSDVVIRIHDSGIGIESHVLPHVFDLFVQADPSSRRDGGLGIGLALVRNLVEQHSGRVTAASAGLGHGSEFTVRLPLPVEAACDSRARPAYVRPGVAWPAPRGSQLAFPQTQDVNRPAPNCCDMSLRHEHRCAFEASGAQICESLVGFGQRVARGMGDDADLRSEAQKIQAILARKIGDGQ